MKTATMALFYLLAVVARAQNARPEFEVSSVKPNVSGSASAINGSVRGNRFSSTNVTISQLVRVAYGVQEFQIAGQPGWFDTDRFDVEARAAQDLKPEDWQPMLQNLLADRFKFAFHRERREAQTLVLVVAKNGPKLTRADSSKCDPAQPNSCGNFRASPTEIIGERVSMTQLATRLSRSIGRMVSDQTGLAGIFDLKLEWTREDAFNEPGASASPAIFAALQDQLGLKLESKKEPVDTLVIDHVEKPSDN
jgi:uncharacterized protein (TIGR03435 family)